ncbi:MAG: prepilin-type N-terminal cleavage/methylation domain-containing protein [Akkermansia sp.]|nr:prepilin-type N-terminal cleavage/methylation domain-containing protein [Akkermansia sp.]
MKKLHAKGFTLTEVVLAIGVVGVLVVVFMAMFIPARKTVAAALTIREADRIVSTLSTELSKLRNTERAEASARQSSSSKYISSFDKAFYWMKNTAKPETTILIYSYRADLGKPVRKDGTPSPYLEGDGSVPGKNTIVFTGCCLASNKERYEDFQALTSPVFAVRMTQLVVQRSKTAGYMYKLANEPGVIYNPYSSGKEIAEPSQYVYSSERSSGINLPWGAEVLYQAEFFQLPHSEPERLKGMRWSQLKDPVFSRNMAFRR